MPTSRPVFEIALAEIPETSRRAPQAAEVERDPLEQVERPIEQELILEVRLNRRLLLTDALLGYLGEGGIILLPLSEMMRVLEFAIEVQPPAGQAEGWFLSEDRRFSLDLAAGEVVVEGQQRSLPPGRAEVHFDDIYVDSRLLSEWFPIEVGVDLSRLTVLVESLEPLPLEARLEREERYGRLGRGAGGLPQYPRKEVPYGALDWPFIDTNISLGLDDNPERPTSFRYSTNITGEAAWMDANVYLTGDDMDKLSSVRLNFGRADPDAELLGPLEATEFAVGDVFTPQLPLISRQTEGRGAYISNFPLFRPTEFDRTTLRGELPLGWEVELYRNEVLIDVQRSSDDGRYEFVEVPLLFGLNIFRLVFYGPQGQRDEEIERIYVGPGLVEPGEGHYRFAFNQHRTPTIDLRDDDDDDAEEEEDEDFFDEEALLFPDQVRRVDPEELEGMPRFFGEYEHGLTQDLSVVAGFAHLPLEDGESHDYGMAGARFDFFGAFARVDGAVDRRGGTALQGQVLADLYGVSVSAEHAQYFDFRSEETGNVEDPLVMESQLRLDSDIPAWVLPSIPFSLQGTYEEYLSGRWETSIANRISAFVGDVRGSHVLDYSLRGDPESKPTSALDGTLLLNWRAPLDIGLRAGFDYSIEPELQARNAQVTLDYDIDRETTLRFGANRRLTGDQVTFFTGSIAKLFDNFAVGFDATLSDIGDYAAGLTIAFSLGLEPRRGRVVGRPRAMASAGAASARVFLDNDQDGAFGEGDEPLEGVGFRGQRDIVTDEEGIAFLTSLSAYRPQAVALDATTLEDPYWRPMAEGHEIVPRPGKTALVDFPVVMTGEIDGTVYLETEDDVRAVSNVELELVDEAGAVVASVKTAFDGFYLFEFVTPGRYEVRVAPAQAERLGLEVPDPKQAVIGNEGEIVGGLDFTVRREAASVPAPGTEMAEGS